MEITPKEINEDVLALCRLVNAEHEPRFVIVEPHQGCKENYCFENVTDVVTSKGGAVTSGWAIWKRDNMYLEAEAHAIWGTSEGNWIDVTPHTPDEKQIVFLPDENVKYNGTRIPSHFLTLTGSRNVEQYISVIVRIREIEDNNRDANGVVKLSGHMLNEYREKKAKVEEMNAAFKKKVGRNDPCPCGSGLKYKRCCGRYR